MREVLKTLSEVEEELPRIVFTQERSKLTDLNHDFSSFQGKDFLNWLNYFSEKEKKFRVLEIGGGVDQVAAKELLKKFGNLYLIEVEKRRIDEELRLFLESSGRYFLFQNGFSEVLEELKRKQKFEMIFLHNVLLHLPNPFFIIEQCFQLLNEGGLLFVNGILIYEEEWERIVKYLTQQRYAFSFKKEKVSSTLQKKGIISVSFTLQRKKSDQFFWLPIREGNWLKDYEGRQLSVKEIFFANGQGF